MAGLPAKLKNWNVFSEGVNYAGVASEIELPPLKKKVEAWRGAGMLGEVDIDLGLEKLEMTTKYGSIMPAMISQFGAVGIDATMLRFAGAYQEDVAGGVVAAELVVRGLHTEVDPGSVKAGNDTEWTVKSTLSYLRWTVSGRVLIEIDLLANVWITDGVDRMADIRAALGE